VFQAIFRIRIQYVSPLETWRLILFLDYNNCTAAFERNCFIFVSKGIALVTCLSRHGMLPRLHTFPLASFHLTAAGRLPSLVATVRIKLRQTFTHLISSSLDNGEKNTVTASTLKCQCLGMLFITKCLPWSSEFDCSAAANGCPGPTSLFHRIISLINCRGLFK
jgi:hypothetical protein